MSATSTVILGGGFGGIATANSSRRLLSAEHEIVVVDESSRFHVGAGKTWIMLGERTYDQISQSRVALLAPAGPEMGQYIKGELAHSAQSGPTVHFSNYLIQSCRIGVRTRRNSATGSTGSNASSVRCGESGWPNRRVQRTRPGAPRHAIRRVDVCGDLGV